MSPQAVMEPSPWRRHSSLTWPPWPPWRSSSKIPVDRGDNASLGSSPERGTLQEGELQQWMTVQMDMGQRWVVDPQRMKALTCSTTEALQCRLSLGFFLPLTWPRVRAGKMTGNVVLVLQYLLLLDLNIPEDMQQQPLLPVQMDMEQRWVEYQDFFLPLTWPLVRAAGSAVSAPAAQSTSGAVETTSWFDQGAGGGQAKDVSSLFADDPESAPVSAQASQVPQPTASVDTSSWFDQGAGGINDASTHVNVWLSLAVSCSNLKQCQISYDFILTEAAPPTVFAGGPPKDVSSLFADDPESAPVPGQASQVAQPTASVDTSSWFDQGAGGGQPKDVSSLFADDPESVPAQASQAPPPVAQATQPTASVDTSSWFDHGAGGGQPKDVSSLFADAPESVPAQASQAPPPVAQATQRTASVDTSSWFDHGAGGGQPKDVSSLFADDPESVPAQASQAAQVTMPAGAVARANGSDAGCTNGVTNDVSSLFADDASPGLFASVAAPAAPDPFAGPTTGSAAWHGNARQPGNDDSTTIPIGGSKFWKSMRPKNGIKALTVEGLAVCGFEANIGGKDSCDRHLAGAPDVTENE
eukprot:s2496_g10.t2